jgi:prepilin-type N-terminal cleavage/methylation domain-containing protein
MNKASSTLAHGFTLIEMTVVLLIMTLLAGVAIRETNSLSFQVRYEQTRERLERIREAILGNPRQIINGQQAVSGFVADMGRLPDNLRELLQSGSCSDPTKKTPSACIAPATWTWTNTVTYEGKCSDMTHTTKAECEDNGHGWLNVGWNGPYLQVSGNPTDKDAFVDGWGRMAQGFCSNITHTNETDCLAPANWTLKDNDNNYGWYYDTETFTNGLRIQSYGKDHVYAGSDYDADYPALETQPAVKSQDWLVDISGGIEISLLKPNSAAIPIASFCTDPSKTTKAACVDEDPDTSAPYGNWIGGCDESGFINRDSCASPKKWFSCNINTMDDGDAGFPTCTAPNCYKTKPTCEQANGVWFGQGYGCSDQAKYSKLNCTGTNVWRSCSDETKLTQSACDAANENWYGDNLVLNDINSVGLSRFKKRDICLKLFYRDPNTSEVTNIVNNTPFTIDENGAYQTISFSFTTPTFIPAGQNAVGIYEHDGTNCTSTLYPADRQSPIQVDFHPRAGLPVINW